MGQPYRPASRAPERLIISDVDFDGQFCDENHHDEDVDPSSPRNRIWNLSIPILESSSFEFASDFSLTTSRSRVMLTDRPSFNSDSTWIRKTGLPLAPHLNFHLLISSLGLLTWAGNTLGPALWGQYTFVFSWAKLRSILFGHLCHQAVSTLFGLNSSGDILGNSFSMKALHSRGWIWSRFVGFGLIRDISSDMSSSYYWIQRKDQYWIFDLLISDILFCLAHTTTQSWGPFISRIISITTTNAKCMNQKVTSTFSFSNQAILWHMEAQELKSWWGRKKWRWSVIVATVDNTIVDNIIVKNISQWPNNCNHCKRIHTALQCC